MLKLKLIPRLTRILSSSSSGKFVSRGFAAGGRGKKKDDEDFYTDYLSQAPSPRERLLDQRSASGSGRRGGGYGSMAGSLRDRGGSRGGIRGRFHDGDNDDNLPAVELSEEELKARQEMEAKIEEQYALEEQKKYESEEESEEDDDGEVQSIYAGFIDPRHDDVIKEQRMLRKRLLLKGNLLMDDEIADEDKDEDLSYLDRESDDDGTAKKKDRRQRRGAVNARGADEEYVSDEDVEVSDTDDEVDEEEYELMEEMNNDEFERHLKHRNHGKKLEEEYYDRLEALGDKADDPMEVEKLEKLMVSKWRAHYLMPRMVTPIEKEMMWKRHKENPEEWTVDKLAEEFEVCKARVHAILFLWDIRKHQGESQTAEAETTTYLENLCFDDEGDPCLPPHMGEDKWVTTWNTKPNYKIMPADWEGTVRTEEEAIEEASAKEEAMMLDEFVRRLEYNKLQMAGLIKQKKHDRRRPPGGWTYLVEKLGPAGKRGKRGGLKFVATADGKHRKLNDLEKLVLKREAVRPRKRIL
ncbi:hypothetical protein GOP47_0028599 [Adiantum capillus-veneris]|nr:hypothetical protein GOP47_0028599 [Adiantum capillus-veneris]